MISEADSTELLQRVPTPTSGSTNLRRLPKKITHLHWQPPGYAGEDVNESLRSTFEWLRRERAGFTTLGILERPFLRVAGDYDHCFDCTISSADLRLLAALSMPIDIDIMWTGDYAVETLPGDFWPAGALQVSGSGWAEPWQWSHTEFGRMVAPLCRSRRLNGQTLTFREVGGYGRPIAHFSVHAVRLLARNDVSVRVVCEPGWPLLPNV